MSMWTECARLAINLLEPHHLLKVSFSFVHLAQTLL